MHLTIRADGGPNIGYGHLVRTGAFASHVIDRGHRVTYVTRTPGPVSETCPEDATVVDLDPADDQGNFLQWVSDAGPDVVLADTYEMDTKRQRSIGEIVPRFAVIVDDAKYAVCADVAINGNVHAPELDYEWVGSEPVWCLGLDYLLFRRSLRRQIGGDSTFREAPKRALITMGGSDTRGTTPTVLRAFDGLDLHVDVIVGPGFQNRTEIDRAADETRIDLEIAENPDDLYERMADADLAVSGTGTTIYELLALGTPTIGLPQARNQEPIAVALVDRGAIATPEEATIHGIAEAIRSLLVDSDRRRRLFDRGVSLVDGRGVERVYDAVVPS